MSAEVASPFWYFSDLNGRPLESGSIYIGDFGLDPEANPVSVFSDEARSVPLAQPVKTQNGYPVLSGTPINIFTEAARYAITVRNKNGVLVYTNLVKASNAVRGLIKFDTVADMQASTTLAIGDEVETLGYDVAGDGGGNKYVVVSSSTGTVDNGSIISLFTHRAKALFPGGVINLKQFGAKSDGLSASAAANSTAFINALVYANGSTLVINPSDLSYHFTGIISCVNPVTIWAYGATLEWSTNANNQGFKSTSSKTKIYGGEWKGPQFATPDPTQIGIWFEGTPPSTFLTKCKIEDADIFNWGHAGIRVRMCQNFDILDNDIYDVIYVGCESLSSKDGLIDNNTIYNLVGNATPEAYGITATKNNGDLTAWPLSERIDISNNVVTNVEIWTGIDTHAGKDINISDNIVYDCKLGVVVTRFDDGTFQFAPKNVKITGNTIVSENIARADLRSGIQIVGFNSTIFADVITCANNTVTGFGSHVGALGTNGDSAGIYISRYGNVTLSDNTIAESGTHGIFCDFMVGSLNGSSNTIRNLTDPVTGSAISFDGDGLNANGSLKGTIIDVSGYIGVYCVTTTDMDMIETKFEAASVNWSQNGGAIACQFLGRVDPVHVGSASYDPPSIPAGGSNSTTITGIPGCSSECVVTDFGVNRDLQGLTIQQVAGDVDTETGDFDLYFYNNTAGALDIASLNILYKIVKPI